MLYVCRNHKNSDNDFYVIHEYPRCPVCELEEYIEELESDNNGYTGEIDDLENEIYFLKEKIEELEKKD